MYPLWGLEGTYRIHLENLELVGSRQTEVEWAVGSFFFMLR
jgi:hypothetical protein